ncbi:MAG: hypothetical protein ACK50J_23475 [Planctomyces sp.]
MRSKGCLKWTLTAVIDAAVPTEPLKAGHPGKRKQWDDFRVIFQADCEFSLSSE